MMYDWKDYDLGANLNLKDICPYFFNGVDVKLSSMAKQHLQSFMDITGKEQANSNIWISIDNRDVLSKLAMA